MKKELGKWFLDISKYIVTAVVLSTIFSDLQESRTLYIFGSVASMLTLFWGLFLVKEPPTPKIRKKKK